MNSSRKLGIVGWLNVVRSVSDWIQGSILSLMVIGALLGTAISLWEYLVPSRSIEFQGIVSSVTCLSESKQLLYLESEENELVFESGLKCETFRKIFPRGTTVTGLFRKPKSEWQISMYVRIAKIDGKTVFQVSNERSMIGGKLIGVAVEIGIFWLIILLLLVARKRKIA